jgi:hypothetical protein
VDDWLGGCEAAGIPAQEITTSGALRREPLVHPKIGRAFQVPDASCDSFTLCGTLRRSAESGGATFLTYHRVDGFHREDGRMSGLRATDLRTGETEDVRASFVVNAAGPWAAEVGKKAAVEFQRSHKHDYEVGEPKYDESRDNEEAESMNVETSAGAPPRAQARGQAAAMRTETATRTDWPTRRRREGLAVAWPPDLDAVGSKVESAAR